MSLWTSIRDTVTGALPTIIGGAVGIPIPPNLGGFKGGPAPGAQSPTIQYLMPPSPSFPGAGDGGEMIPTAGTIPKVGAALGALGRNWLISARGIVSTVTGRLLGVMRGTKLFRTKQVTELAKRVGIEATAVALGISAVEVAQLIAADVQRPKRRGRGISARDVRTTRRTIGKIRTIEHALSQSGICRPRARARRS